jgi:hypothetical protein
MTDYKHAIAMQYGQLLGLGKDMEMASAFWPPGSNAALLMLDFKPIETCVTHWNKNSE